VSLPVPQRRQRLVDVDERPALFAGEGRHALGVELEFFEEILLVTGQVITRCNLLERV